MALDTTRRNALHTWFAGALGYPCVWANQKMPQPAKPYGTLQVTTPDDPGPLPGAGRDEVRLAAATPGVQTYWEHRQHTLSLQVYSDDTTGSTNAPELLAKALRKLNRETERAVLFAAGISVQTAGRVRDLTGMLPTRPESRAQADLVVTTVDTQTETVGYVEQVEVELEVEPLDAETKTYPEE